MVSHEMDVGGAAVVVTDEDCVKGSDTGGVGRLHTTQGCVVLKVRKFCQDVL